jgi:capsular polysaccharide biosynthesis protein
MKLMSAPWLKPITARAGLAAAALRRSLWSIAQPEDGLRLVYEHEEACFDGFDMSATEDPQVCRLLRQENERWNLQQDRIYQIEGPVWLEPSMSLGMMRPRTFIEQTKCMAHKHLYPDVSALIGLNRIDRATKLDAAILFDGYSALNHFHYFDDALKPLMLMMSQGLVDKHIALIYNHQLENLKWFQYFRNREPFKDLNWRCQAAGEWLECKKLYRASTTTRWWNRLPLPDSAEFVGGAGQRVFVDRMNNNGRAFVNADEIRRLLEKLGFRTVFLETMSYKEQQAVFANATHIVAHHGAGLTNLLYANLSKTRVIEMFPSNYVMPHYYWITLHRGGCYYDGVTGGGLSSDGKGYFMEPGRLRERVLKMMESQ